MTESGRGSRSKWGGVLSPELPGPTTNYQARLAERVRQELARQQREALCFRYGQSR
jgi:hypothetical protein